MRAGGPRPPIPSRTSARRAIYLYWFSANLRLSVSPTGFPRPFSESPDIKVGLSSANRHNLRGVSSPSVIE